MTTKISIQIGDDKGLSEYDLVGCCIVCGEDIDLDKFVSRKFICDDCGAEYTIEFVEVDVE